ncbi:MAG: flagellar biosynthesis protein FliQ [Vampirovibrionales bacterium]|nr:flagellar biosynthesis protein FliQ [Vampirovibrionales bacterium]
MQVTDLSDMIQRAVWMMLMLSSPLLVGALILGVIISVLQTITQVQEATLTFVPKILLLFGMLVFLSPWLIGQTIDYTTSIFEQMIFVAQRGHNDP